MKISSKPLAIAAAPSVIMLLLFYSLAFHMHRALGGWPTSIGERGFPPALVTHCLVATWYLGAFVTIGGYGIPVALIVSASVARWRRAAVYFGLYLVFAVISCALMLMAPSPYLHWWRD